MAFIAPLRGVRFDTDKAGRLDDIVTPPYDVIREQSAEAFLAKNPYSMVRLDITKAPGSGAVDRERYVAAANLFNTWRKEGILIRDEEDALYLYETRYTLHSGKKMVRRGLLCLVGLAEFSEGVVKPHEHTFDTVVADRLQLLQHCKAQFSQIFSLYSDPDNAVIALLEGARSEPAGSVTDADGCVHSIHRVTDPTVIRQVQLFFRDQSLYIADGHHRYTTALGYRRYLREQQGELPVTHPANHIMMYLCPMEDPGLSVLPTHRLLYWPGGLDVAELTRRLQPGFELEEIHAGSRESLIEEALSRMDEIEQRTQEKTSTSFGVYHPGEDRCFVMTMKAGVNDRFEIAAPCLKDLDVVVLSELIVKKYFGLDHQRCESEDLIHFYSDPDEALDAAVKDCAEHDDITPLLFLMNPTRVEQVRKVADANHVMPHKSTYFYPKIMTGLLFYQLVDNEMIKRLE
jgi:uncharacterized protein (DUF1015 family)